MRRVLAGLLIFLFISNICVFSADELESVIDIVKSKISIPSEFTVFESSSQNTAKGIEWRLWWRTPDSDHTTLRAEISVIADQAGNIIRYYKFGDDYIKNEDTVHFSTYDKSTAKDFAYRFMSKVRPEVLTRVSLYEEPDLGELHSLKTAAVSYCRVENNIPFYSNYLKFVVDLNKGEVIEFDCMWDENIVLPSPEQAITPQAARRAYDQQSGISLRYRLKYDEAGNKKAYLVYAPNDDENVVDALNSRVYAAYNKTIRGQQPSDSSNLPTVAQKQPLSEQDVIRINETESIISVADAEEYVRSIKTIALSPDYELRSSSYYMQDTRYVVYLEFANLPKKDPSQLTDKERAMIAAGDYSYVRINLDAVNRDIISMYIYNKEAKILTNAVREAYAKDAVDKFLQRYLKNKYENCRFKEVQRIDGDRTYKFIYSCMIAGVPFEGNDIQITYSAISGEIVTIECNWQHSISVQGANHILDVTSALNIMYDQSPLTLMYMIKGNKSEEALNNQEDVVLVYGFTPYIPRNLLADTGELVSSKGKIFKNIKYDRFTDIEGHFAGRHIQKLANNGIISERGDFFPDNIISQRDYLSLLMLGIKGQNFSGDSDMYAAAFRFGIISAEEKDPYAEVSREKAVVMMIRALGLDSIARLEGIYLLDFADKDEINPELQGHVALAKGFGIVGGNDGMFNPQGSLTKATAAVMIFNYLNRK